MATQNAIDTNKPIGVDDGGTGAATLTDGGVLVGSGTVAITPLAVGATGTLLVGTVGSDPVFATSAIGDFTFTSSTANETRLLTVINTDNTAASTSAARIDVTVGGGNVADPQVKFLVTGGATFSSGIDNSDSDKFKISASSALGTTDVFVCTSAGEITKPLTPAFLSYLGTTDSDVTGDGTNFTLGSGNALTVVFDQGGDFNTNGTFTAPVTGRYFFNSSVRLDDLTASHTTTYIQLVTSNASYTSLLFDGGGAFSPGDFLIIPVSAFVDMDASDTATISVFAIGGAKVVDVVALGRGSSFSGFLVC